ncbi:unnamed protein product [Prorocentrum cordatum]|uniref:Uncharacterized protein n=1 Tax=Prorocentrum cordatum TaxID=2364126 RepID=A0ABN9WJV3_9DINO|nr:unnamed protein product [Polarella glacialis]
MPARKRPASGGPAARGRGRGAAPAPRRRPARAGGGAAGGADAPEGHAAHEHVRLRRGFATFRLDAAVAESAKDWARGIGPGAHPRRIQPAHVRVDPGELGGDREAALRVARLAFVFAQEQGAAVGAVRRHVRLLCREEAGGEAPPPAAKRPRVKGPAAGGAPALPPLRLSELRVPDVEHPVAEQRAEPEWVSRLMRMINSRETIAKNRAEGRSGAAVYAGVDPEFLPYFQRRACPNVQRRNDRTQGPPVTCIGSLRRRSVCACARRRPRRTG